MNAQQIHHERNENNLQNPSPYISCDRKPPAISIQPQDETSQPGPYYFTKYETSSPISVTYKVSKTWFEAYILKILFEEEDIQQRGDITNTQHKLW